MKSDLVDVITGQDEARYDYYGIMKDIGMLLEYLQIVVEVTEISLFTGDR